MAKLLALLVVGAAVAWPAPARAQGAQLVVRDYRLSADRAPAAPAPGRFNLVGLHWRGSGSVSFRTRVSSGRWSAWRAAAPEPEDGPDSSRREARRQSWRIGNPYWTGTSDRIEYRLRGRVSRLRANFVWSPVAAVPARTLSLAGSPPIVTRAAWGADETLRRDAPSYAPAVRYAVVHHTAGSGTYTAAEAPAVVRGIYLYHVRSNGWDDIGYNFLVDRFGRVYEGRFGGVERNVVGAHAQGFNTGSTGVALMGRYDSATISAQARAALASLLAWRLDVAHVDPLSVPAVLSSGNPRYPRGTPVFVRAVSGHRDTGPTECPGEALYAELDALALAVSQTGAPKLFAPSIQGALGTPVRFTATLSEAIPWTVTITDPAGAVVASGSGVGTAVDWTWDATAAPGRSYTYAVAAAGARGVRGTLTAKAVALALTKVDVRPRAVTPNGDGVDDAATVTYSLSAPATVTATLTDAAGTTLATLFAEPRAAGSHRFGFGAEGLADGVYRIVLTAAAGGRRVTSTLEVLVNRTLSGLVATPAVFSPNGDGRLDTARIAFALAAPATVTVRIARGASTVATLLGAAVPAGPQELVWDGNGTTGRAADGRYDAEVSVTDAAGTIAHRLPLAVDTRGPSLRLLTLRPPRLTVNEPARVALVVNGKRFSLRRETAGSFAVPGIGRARRVSGSAVDAVGNRGRSVRFPR